MTGSVRQAIIVAGPNGAGKTTFVQEYLPAEDDCLAFVNADLIAAGLSPLRPAGADFHVGRVMLRELDRHVRAGKSFVVEATLAGRHYIARIRRWRTAGYRVNLVFLDIESPEVAIQRIRQRVRKGGHDIPESVVHRRFHASRRNFHEIYCSCVDAWQRFDNSGTVPVLLDEGGNAFE